MSEEIKNEITAVVATEKIEQTDNDDIFVSEKDTFTITIKYYKGENGLVVRGVDDEFNENSPCKSFDMSFKYPSYADSQSIHVVSGVKINGDIGVNDLMALQNARIITLFRSWTLSGNIDKINQMNVKLVKAIRNSMISSIGMEGIL